MSEPKLLDWSDLRKQLGQSDLAELAHRGERASRDHRDDGAPDFGPDDTDQRDLRTSWGAPATSPTVRDFLARKARKANRKGLAVYRLPRGAFLPDDDPETLAGLWRQLSFAEQRTFVGGCCRTDGKTWAIRGSAANWPAACTSSEARGAALGRLVQLGVWCEKRTAAGERRYGWTPLGRGLFYLRSQNSPTSFRAQPYKRPRYVPIHALLVDSGLLQLLRPTALAVLPFLQWMGRLTVTDPDRHGRHGWGCPYRRLEALAGIGDGSARRAVQELRAVGLVRILGSSGRQNVYSWTGCVRAGEHCPPVSLGDRWTYACAVLRDGLGRYGGPVPWPAVWLAVMGRAGPAPPPS